MHKNNKIPKETLGEKIKDKASEFKEEIKEDTEIILSNIYDGTSKEINTDAIREKLISNISDSIDGRSFTQTEEKAINSFADTICSTYKDALSHTKYEQKIHSLYEEAINYKKLLDKICLIATGISTVLIIIINTKAIRRRGRWRIKKIRMSRN